MLRDMVRIGGLEQVFDAYAGEKEALHDYASR
jgi:hypothetical protein